jgi:hypothetical protein
MARVNCWLAGETVKVGVLRGVLLIALAIGLAACG